ncbi:MAG: 3-oxoacyl-[acyl-carrier-protein] synthase III C-terminal domain-containing protein, partial [bacterium]
DDAAGLMWIENELKRKDLSAADRQELEALQTKGLAGELRQSDLANWRKKGKKVDTIRSYLNKFRSFRTRCARITGMPPEVIHCLDDAIGKGKVKSGDLVALVGSGVGYNYAGAALRMP